MKLILLINGRYREWPVTPGTEELQVIVRRDDLIVKEDGEPKIVEGAEHKPFSPPYITGEDEG